MTRRLLLLAILPLFLLAACSNPPEDRAEPAPGKVAEETPLDTTIRINLGGEPGSFDPGLVTDLAGNNILQALMEGLVRLDLDCKPHPAAAESWEHNADYTVWTFKLRKNGKWQNGDPVTAHDFVYSVERILTPSTKGDYSGMVYSLIKGGKEFYTGGGLDKGMKLEGVKALDDYTVEYTMVNPTPFFASFTSFGCWFPVHRKTVEKHGEKWTLSPENFVGNGPFKPIIFSPKDRIEAVKADTYWDAESIFWQKVIIRFIDEDNTEDSAFRTRDLDITETVAVPQVNYWKDKPEFRTFPGFGTIFVAFYTKRPPFDNKLVRKAFSKAISRKLIVERVTRRGEGIPEGIVPRGIPSADGKGDYRDRAGNFVGDQDIEAAKALLKEAGITDPKQLGKVEYLYNTREENKIIAEQLQSMWKTTLGVDVQLQNAEWSVVIGRLRGDDFMCGRSSWFGDYLDPLQFLEIFQTDNPINASRFNNAKYDELVNAAKKETDLEKREQYFIQAEKILIEDEAVVAPVFVNNFAYLIQTDLEGVGSNVIGQKLFVRGKRVRK
jgi:oligopeptide transport system substrate-binding protein